MPVRFIIRLCAFEFAEIRIPIFFFRKQCSWKWKPGLCPVSQPEEEVGRAPGAQSRASSNKSRSTESKARVMSLDINENNAGNEKGRGRLIVLPWQAVMLCAYFNVIWLTDHLAFRIFLMKLPTVSMSPSAGH